jgi:hypothetical protein
VRKARCGNRGDDRAVKAFRQEFGSINGEHASDGGHNVVTRHKASKASKMENRPQFAWGCRLRIRDMVGGRRWTVGALGEVTTAASKAHQQEAPTSCNSKFACAIYEYVPANAKTTKDVSKSDNHQRLSGSAQGEVVRGSACGAGCREITLAACNPELELVWCSPQPASLISFLGRLRSLVPICLSFLSVLDRRAVCDSPCGAPFSTGPPSTYHAYSRLRSASQPHTAAQDQTPYHLMHVPTRFAR